MANYVVVSRKYRPIKFSEILGQNHVTQTLQNAIRTGRVAHGYIFSGSRGIGKTTAARILAKALNCEKILSDEKYKEIAEPCGNCENCKDFEENRSLNIFEFDAASNNSVDDIRLLRENVRYGPQKGKYRIYIIDEFHMLSTAAFNAFLKTLEEPPPHAIFIFATTELHKVPLTISSRCQKFIFKRLPSEEIAQGLMEICKKENFSIEQSAVELISQKADGAMRDAQSLLEQIVSFSSEKEITYTQVASLLNTIDHSYFFDITNAMKEKNYSKMIEISDFIYLNGYDGSYFLIELIKHFRNILVCKAVRSSKLIEVAQNIKKMYEENADVFSTEALLEIVTLLTTTEKEIKFFKEPQLKLELVLLKLIELATYTSGTIEHRLEKLETDVLDIKKKS